MRRNEKARTLGVRVGRRRRGGGTAFLPIVAHVAAGRFDLLSLPLLDFCLLGLSLLSFSLLSLLTLDLSLLGLSLLSLFLLSININIKYVNTNI